MPHNYPFISRQTFGFFFSLVNMNNVAIKTSVQIFVWMFTYLLDLYLGVEFLCQLIDCLIT